MRFDKIDPVLCLVVLALPWVELEVHEDVRNGLTTWKRLFVHAVVELLEAAFAQGFRRRRAMA